MHGNSSESGLNRKPGAVVVNDHKGALLRTAARTSGDRPVLQKCSTQI